VSRLQTMLSCIRECGTLADIGTDHAYLPIEAVRGGLCKKAIACDIVKGPLDTAKKNIKAAGLENYIETRLGDGLQPLQKNEADCIVIAGMGGMNIMEILESPKAGNSKLILQAQHDLEELRRFLHAKKYRIKEYLVRERSRFYVVTEAEKAGTIETWTDKEYFLGKAESEDLQAYFCGMHSKIAKYIDSLDGTARKLAEKRMAWLKK
jgi:tRNA (adenine22-N1)-methyltransferase